MTISITRRTLLRAALVGTAAVAASTITGCTPVPAPSLRMAGGEPGGTYVRFGELLGAALVRSGAAGSLDVMTTAGSVENVRLLQNGDADLAISLADAIADDDVVAVGRVYQNYLQCIVGGDSGLTTLDALRGRDVSIGATGSGTALTMRRLLQAAGVLDDTGVRIHEMRLADAVDRFEAGELSAVFWSGGVALPEMERLQPATGLTLIDLTAALPALTLAHRGVYQPTVIPAGVYDLMESLPAIGVSNLLLVRPDASDAFVTALVDRLIEDAAALVPQPSVGVQFLTPSNLIDTAPVPLHPAAARAYRRHYG
ncbi:TAXI family TRAP transporter solute-binding subunit [Microbacterium gorillae]|uniref:TAXI family TRAP transporter solute-binding subunit n=1 Tax=Microbacterium gorillae TaxID=1231063 RepID=UPI0006934345|nr:TAXI family TRAP transporter solute-binding subunit [Microbacterium gorillae]